MAVVVHRGWVPADATEIPPRPRGEVEIVVRVRPEEGHLDRRPPPGQVYTLNTAQVVRAAGVALDMPVVQGYGQVVDAEPPLRGLPEPDRDLGPHLSYAFQWWFFAALGIFGFGYLAWDERRKARRPGRQGAGSDESTVTKVGESAPS